MNQNEAIKRLGIFGGSFDPPHHAHITLALRAIEQLHLDRLLVIPTGDAWHKTRDLTLAPHRLAMTRLAFSDVPKAMVDSREIDRQGSTFTFDTIEEIMQDYPSAKLFLCIGGDQAQAFTTWHRWKDILNRVTVVVAFRPEDKNGAQSDNNAQWHNGLPAGAIRLEMPSLAISATDIRLQLAQSDTFPSALPMGVCEYIQQHSLYKNDR
jgi:nicotinate-nucleotide adenylyltransferase